MPLPTVTLSGPYVPRKIRFIKRWKEAEEHGWYVKVIGVREADATERKDTPDPELVDAALSYLLSIKQPPAPDPEHGRYGIGFVIVHQGKERHYVTIYSIEDENVSVPSQFVSTKDRPFEFRRADHPPRDCYWDGSARDMEMTQWKNYVLEGARDDVERFLEFEINLYL